MILLLFFLPLLFSTPVYAKHEYPEKVYQKAWCEKMGGQAEYVVSGGSRVDCLLDKYAVEVEFVSKWQQAIGQALYYSRKTERKPGILLILEKETDRKYLGRLFYTIKKRGTFIKVWIIKPEDLQG